MQKSDWIRTSRACDIGQIRPEHIIAIEGHAREFELDEPLKDVSYCMEHTYTFQKSFMKSHPPGVKDNIQYVSYLITPHWLIRGQSGDKSQPFAVYYYLQNLEVSDFTPTLIQDWGLNITTMIHNGLSRVSFFMGFENQAEAEVFKSILKDAVKKAS